MTWVSKLNDVHSVDEAIEHELQCAAGSGAAAIKMLAEYEEALDAGDPEAPWYLRAAVDFAAQAASEYHYAEQLEAEALARFSASLENNGSLEAVLDANNRARDLQAIRLRAVRAGLRSQRKDGVA